MIERILQSMISLCGLKRNELESVIKDSLPIGENYDSWTVHVKGSHVVANTLYTGNNNLGKKKFANIEISFNVSSPSDVNVSYEDNSIEIREWIEENEIDNIVRKDVFNRFSERTV